MQNLDQIRAAAALRLCQNKNFSRNDVAGFPAMILGNGLLSACAFASEPGRENRTGIAAAVEGMAKHLANPCHNISVLRNVQTASDLLGALSENGSSLDLQRATQEALAFFSYLKRFSVND